MLAEKGNTITLVNVTRKRTHLLKNQAFIIFT